MRKKEYIVIHCSAGNQKATAEEISAYHLRPVAKGGMGWSKPGYHFFIEADGTIKEMWPIEKSSNGVGPKVNPVAINVCYAGGVDTSKPGLPPIDNRTPGQKEALLFLVKRLKEMFPNAEVRGHRDFANKACPSFDATTEYAGV